MNAVNERLVYRRPSAASRCRRTWRERHQAAGRRRPGRAGRLVRDLPGRRDPRPRAPDALDARGGCARSSSGRAPGRRCSRSRCTATRARRRVQPAGPHAQGQPGRRVGNVWTHPAPPPRPRVGDAGAPHRSGSRARPLDADPPRSRSPTTAPRTARPPDADFAMRRGFALDLSNVVRVLDLPVDEERVQRLADEAAPHHRDYTCASSSVASLTTSRRSSDGVGSLIGRGALGRGRQGAGGPRRSGSARRGGVRGVRPHEVHDGAVAPDGELAAYSELVVPLHDPGRVFQWGPSSRRPTAVTGWDGHQGARPALAGARGARARTSLVTFNAEVNRHMIAVNEALGFRRFERQVEMHRSLT